MGNKQGGESGGDDATALHVLSLISHPEDEAGLRELFESFDANKTGSLDKEEWLSFGRYLWKADVEDVLSQEGKTYAHNERAGKEQVFKDIGMGGLTVFQDPFGQERRRANFTGKALSKLVKPKDAEAWIANMFDKADKDKGGSVTFDEFKSFLQNESKKEMEIQRRNFKIATREETAMRHANNEANKKAAGPLGELVVRQNEAILGAMLGHGDGIQAQAWKDQTAPYKVGEIPPAALRTMAEEPSGKMKALYEAKPQLVKDHYFHALLGETAEVDALEAANPDLKEAAAKMKDYQTKKMDALMQRYGMAGRGNAAAMY